MGPIGVPEMLAIFVIALLLFGPKKLPELGRTLGKAITEFRRASNELKSTFESHLTELEKEVQLEKQSGYSHPTSSPATYPYTHDEYGQYLPDYNGGTSEVPAQTVEHSSTTAAHDTEIHRDPPHYQAKSETALYPSTSETEPAPARAEESHGA